MRFIVICELPLAAVRLRLRLFASLLTLFATSMTIDFAIAQKLNIVELRNGMILGPGQVSYTDSISTNSYQRGSAAGEVQVKSLLLIDNGLTVTYANGSGRNIASVQDYNGQPFEEIEFPAEDDVSKSGANPAIQGILGVTKFNEYGRRRLAFATARGRVDVLQGITSLTPVYAKVEVLRTKTDQFAWDQRVAPASIPNLREILIKALDPEGAQGWLTMVRYYMQAERYVEARDLMEQALEKFPIELAANRPVLAQLDELLARQKFDEIKLRRGAGQTRLASQLLLGFQGKALETQVELRAAISAIQNEISETARVTGRLQKSVGQLTADQQQLIAPLIDELLNEVTLDSVQRLVEFNRLSRDPDIPAESLVAYAIGGWLLGPNNSIGNFAVATSLYRVRGLVKEYLREETGVGREQILRQLQSEEGAQPNYLAKLIAVMKPPLDLPAHDTQDPPGLHRLSISRPDGSSVDYVIQLPPEYDANRKYPCVLALPGRGDAPELEIDIWCGVSSGGMRLGQASRRGYVVVSPNWMRDGQATYQYTESEHDRILATLRDAQRRVSVDTDRIFIAGHHDGATAAWDVALAHPDLWAGAIMISPTADKYITHYSENIRASQASQDARSQIPLATYIVYGQYDGTRSSNDLGTVATRYLKSSLYDCMVVEYRGSGRMRFNSELPRVAEWMELPTHRRVRTPRVIETITMRPGDRFFYWLEVPALLDSISGNPYLLDPSARGKFEAMLNAPNSILVRTVPSPRNSATVWLSPDMVDFDRPVSIRVEGEKWSDVVTPDIAVMLEDVRQRGDRMHLFWQRVDF